MTELGEHNARPTLVITGQRRRKQAATKEGRPGTVTGLASWWPGSARCGQVKISPVPRPWLVSPCCSRIVIMSCLARPETTGNGAPLAAEDMLGCPFPGLLLTATTATNGHSQRSATAQNMRTIRANWGYARPAKRKVGSRGPRCSLRGLCRRIRRIMSITMLNACLNGRSLRRSSRSSSTARGL